MALEGITGDGKVEKVLTSRRPMKADAVLLAMGNRPNTEFLADSGLEMFKGTLLVDGDMRTNDPDIYAVGDCALVTNRITGQRQWSAMGSTANIAGGWLLFALPGGGRPRLSRRAGHWGCQAARREHGPHRPYRGCRKKRPALMWRPSWRRWTTRPTTTLAPRR